MLEGHHQIDFVLQLIEKKYIINMSVLCNCANILIYYQKNKITFYSVTKNILYTHTYIYIHTHKLIHIQNVKITSHKAV